MVSLKDLGFDEAELTAKANNIMESLKWFDKNKNKLRKSYANKYIAIFNKKVLDSDKKLDELRFRLKKGSIGLDNILIEFINPEELLLILQNEDKDMRLNAIRGFRQAYYLGIIRSDELTIGNPMKFVIDTGSMCTVISAFYFENDFSCNNLQRSIGSIGVGGFQETYILHNVHLLLYTLDQEWNYIGNFREMEVLPRKYDERTDNVIPIPCLLGMDIIGVKYKLIYGKRKIFLEG